ncbi:MAG: inositol-3-phosphate synthase, partial [Bacteroides sp.]
MEQQIKSASGRLGVLVVGVGGAVSSTFITGTLAARKGLTTPIGSTTQLATIRLKDGEKRMKDVIPLTDL